MPKMLTVKAIEGSTFSVRFEFTNTIGEDLTMITLNWTLTDLDGTVINSREDVTVTAPTASETIALSGNDLAIQDQDNKTERRLLTIKATYDTGDGALLPLNDWAQFVLYNAKAITT